MTLNSNWALGSAENLLIAISSRSTLILIGNTYYDPIYESTKIVQSLIKKYYYFLKPYSYV